MDKRRRGKGKERVKGEGEEEGGKVEEDWRRGRGEVGNRRMEERSMGRRREREGG